MQKKLSKLRCKLNHLELEERSNSTVQKICFISQLYPANIIM